MRCATTQSLVYSVSSARAGAETAEGRGQCDWQCSGRAEGHGARAAVQEQRRDRRLGARPAAAVQSHACCCGGARCCRRGVHLSPALPTLSGEWQPEAAARQPAARASPRAWQVQGQKSYNHIYMNIPIRNSAGGRGELIQLPLLRAAAAAAAWPATAACCRRGRVELLCVDYCPRDAGG